MSDASITVTEATNLVWGPDGPYAEPCYRATLVTPAGNAYTSEGTTRDQAITNVQTLAG